MLPSIVSREVQSTLKNYLITEFAPSNAYFRDVIGKLAGESGSWIHGPFIQFSLPFRSGTSGKSFFPNFQTEFPGFLHQEKSWQRLTGESPKSTLVATGTGSGKTECFLYPVLNHCIEAKKSEKKGIKVLVIYPMNALATDQARRFAEVISGTPELNGLRVGLYVGGNSKPGSGSKVMTPDGVITDRDTLRESPPDILLTNYKMLDYMLIRPEDKKLWAGNEPETLKYIIVDELHTFDGAQGTDLAILLRRLKARLQTPEDHLVAVGTSATLGDSGDTTSLREYAKGIFSTDFTVDSVITEDRINENEFIGSNTIEYLLHDHADLIPSLDPKQYQSQEEAIAKWFSLVFDEEQPTIKTVQTNAFKKELGRKLKRHLMFVNLLKVVKNQTLDLESVAYQIKGPLPSTLKSYAGELVDVVVALISWARAENGLPLLNLRIQLWIKELRRLVSTVNPDPTQAHIHSADEPSPEGSFSLPLIQCSECYYTGWVTRLSPSNPSQSERDVNRIYSSWFAKNTECARFYPYSNDLKGSRNLTTRFLCSGCGNHQLEQGACRSCGNELLLKVGMFELTSNQNRSGVSISRHDHTCPACNTKDRLRIIGSRSASLGSVFIESYWSSKFNEDKKLIAFSDSVQDASHRSGFFGSRTYINAVRTGITQSFGHLAQNLGELTLKDAVTRISEPYFESRSPLAMSKERFVSLFAVSTLQHSKAWFGFTNSGELFENSALLTSCKRLLAWNLFSDLSFKSNRRLSLNATGSLTVYPKLELLTEASEIFSASLKERFDIDLSSQECFKLLYTFVIRLIKKGAVKNEELSAVSFLDEGNFYSIQKGSDRGDWMSGIRGGRPLYVSEKDSKDFLYFRSHYLTSFAEFLFSQTEFALRSNSDRDDLTISILSSLTKSKLLIERTVRKGPETYRVWYLDDDNLLVTANNQRVSSDEGHFSSYLPLREQERLIGVPHEYNPLVKLTTGEDRTNVYAEMYRGGDLYRIYPFEHTGLLEREKREGIEKDFKADPQQPWYTNLLSATPTLEMGVDVGTLSATMLCSIPRNVASFLQRIGRSGRKTGNSFTFVIADSTNPREMHYFESPLEMISGDVKSPGIFLGAYEVLRRQYFAFCLDSWVCTFDGGEHFPSEMRHVLDNLEKERKDAFPLEFVSFAQEKAEDIWGRFINLLELEPASELAVRLRAYSEGTTEVDSLRVSLIDVLTTQVKKREQLVRESKKLNTQLQTLRAKPQDEAVQAEIEDLKKLRSQINSEKKELNTTRTLELLTDYGLIPNYAFPESGIELKSYLYNKKDDNDDEERSATQTEKFERSGRQGLRDFAPLSYFYGNGNKVQVRRLNLNSESEDGVKTFRFCPQCNYCAPESTDQEKKPVCIRCGEVGFGANGQTGEVLKLKQVFSNTEMLKAKINDARESREEEFFNTQLLIDFERNTIISAYKVSDSSVPFGFEFVSRANFKEFNFGRQHQGGSLPLVAGVEIDRPGYRVCRSCGEVQKPEHEEQRQQHSFDCELRKDPENPGNLFHSLYVYREFNSEMLRILVPPSAESSDTTVQSFMAGLWLGLESKFGGKVDHLSTEVQTITTEEHGQRRFVCLYDTVPGGTGYLQELLSNKASSLKDVFRLGLTHLRACSCANQAEKDGCYRCVLGVGHGVRSAMTKRTTALGLFQQLNEVLDSMEETTSIDTVKINSAFDSELEAKFIPALKALSNNRSIGGELGDKRKPMPEITEKKDVVNGGVGYHLTVGKYKYLIETQRDLDKNDGIDLPTRPDFLIHPRGVLGTNRVIDKPIAIYLDGWQHHRNRITDDFAKRSSLVCSGKFYVWNLVWWDVVDAAEGKTEPRSVWQHLMGWNIGSVPPPARTSLVAECFDENAMSLLLRILSGQVSLSSMRLNAYTIDYGFGRTTLENSLTRKISEPPFDLPDTQGAYFSKGLFKRLDYFAELHRPVAVNPSLTLREDANRPSIIHLRTEDGDKELDQVKASWEVSLTLMNQIQFLTGCIFITDQGIAKKDYEMYFYRSNKVTNDSTEADGDWEPVRKKVVEDIQPFIKQMEDRKLPTPKLSNIGYEEFKDEDLILEAEILWEAPHKLVLLLPEQEDYAQAWNDKGYQTVIAEGDWIESLLNMFKDEK